MNWNFLAAVKLGIYAQAKKYEKSLIIAVNFTNFFDILKFGIWVKFDTRSNYLIHEKIL